MIPPPTQTGNPVADELINLSPGAKDALMQGVDRHIATTGTLRPGDATSAPPSDGPVQGAIPLPQRQSSPMGVPEGVTTPGAIPVPQMASKPVTNGAIPVPAKFQPPPTPMYDELSRVTKAPLSGDQAHTTADTGRSGIGQIHNPWARIPLQILDAVGRFATPGLEAALPGTEGHHQEVVADARGAAKEEQGENESVARQAHEAAGTEEEQARTAGLPADYALKVAQTDETKARTEAIKNPTKALSPKDKYLTVGDGVFNAESGDWAKAPTDKKLAEVTEIDPVKGKALGLTPNKDGKYLVPNASLGELLKAPPEKVIPPEQQFLDEYKANHPGSSIAEAETAFKKIQPPEKPPQALMVGPGGVVQDVKPGSVVAPGSMAPGQVGQTNVAADKKTQAKLDAAESAKEDYALAQEYAKTPSPTNDFALMMHFIGATKPDSIGKLRLNQQEIKLVLGLRSAFQDVEAWGQKFSNGQLLPPEQRQHMLDTMKIIADRAQSHAAPAAASATGAGGPTIDDINAEVARRKAAKGAR